MDQRDTTGNHGKTTDFADDAERRTRLDQLEQLERDLRRLEQERLGARSTPARLVALDVELCRVEAARRMLAPSPWHDPDP
ncbi:hypothetical protein [Paraliomyxa miuraensis]|uniref:hypothetical protein n=1 Tax=Paraliomyxa miuraensis TaxID=376150 RepID=UPI002257012D|nr:hypothetical protein [Paraliomyxa miuraensis]MCX4247147.1 DUF4391 domain-containing protein [Paraliomyxa miuraensis]